MPSAANNNTLYSSGDGQAYGNGKFPRLDALDRQIMRHLQASCNVTNAALAQRLGISAPATQQRIRKLESCGIITGYVALLNPTAVCKSIFAIVHVSLLTHTSSALQRAKAALAQFDEILSCWHTAGDDDFVLRVLVNDMEQYEEFVSQKLSTVPDLGRIRTAFVLSTVKHTTQIPMPDGAGQPTPTRSAGKSAKRGSKAGD